MRLHDYKAMFLLCGYRPETSRQHSYVGFVATYLLPSIFVAMHQPGLMTIWLCRYVPIKYICGYGATLLLHILLTANVVIVLESYIKRVETVFN